jgi:hypothetical protein
LQLVFVQIFPGEPGDLRGDIPSGLLCPWIFFEDLFFWDFLVPSIISLCREVRDFYHLMASSALSDA